MDTTVIVELDGSPVSERALPYARALCERTGAELALVSIVKTESTAETRSARRNRAASEQQTQERRRYLSELLTGFDELTARADVRVGDPDNELPNYANGLPNPVLVTPRHGWMRHRRKAARQRNDDPDRRLIIPLLPGTSPRPTFERVLIPISSQRPDLRLIDATVATLGPPALHLYLLWVSERPRWAARAFSRGLVDDALLALESPTIRQTEEQVRARLPREHAVTWIFADHGRRPDAAIRSTTGWLDVDLVAMKAADRRLDAGSERRLLEHAGCPVLLISAAALERMYPHPGGCATDEVDASSVTANDSELVHVPR